MKILITGGSGFIGTNTVDHYIAKGFEVLNIDWKPPRKKEHQKYWCDLDILNGDKLTQTIKEFAPDYVIHLAARTDLNGKSLDDYAQNTKGVENMVRALRETPSVKRVIFTSTQLVCARRNPKDENDFETINFYGESKKLGELFLRSNKDLPFEYAIVRPTSIWGPWFEEPYCHFFYMVINGHYFHMGGKDANRTFGFVGNAIYQMETILLDAPYCQIEGRIFYLGDRPAVSIRQWANEIAAEVGIRIPTIPFFVFKTAALVGDFLKLFHIAFPMTSYRLTNMTTSFENDVESTYSVAPDPPYLRAQGTKITLDWIKSRTTA